MYYNGQARCSGPRRRLSMRRIMTRDKSFYRRLVSLTIPVALQNLITFAVNFADNLMVSSLGDAAVSGVYMAGQLQTFLQLFSGGVEGAILILSAQYWGKNDRDAIKRICSIGLHFSLVFGLLVTLVSLTLTEPVLSLFTSDPTVIACGKEYLRIVCLSFVLFCATQALIAAMRSVEAARIGMVVSSISLVFNISLNYVMIFGHLGCPALGLRGAALATLISRAVELVSIGFYVGRVDQKLKLCFRDFLRSDKALRHDFIRYGMPLVINNVVWSVNTMGNSAILGRYGAEVITAASVANTLNSLAYVTMNGMSSAVGIITGKTIGAGKTELMREYARTVQVIFACLGLVTCGMMFLLRLPFIGLYAGISEGAVAYARQFTVVLSIAMAGTCYQAASLYGLVKCGGDITFVFKLDCFFVFLVVLPSALLAQHLGAAPWIVFACLKCDQILKCFVAVVKINSFNWMKNLTRER